MSYVCSASEFVRRAIFMSIIASVVLFSFYLARRTWLSPAVFTVVLHRTPVLDYATTSRQHIPTAVRESQGPLALLKKLSGKVGTTADSVSYATSDSEKEGLRFPNAHAHNGVNEAYSQQEDGEKDALAIRQVPCRPIPTGANLTLLGERCVPLQNIEEEGHLADLSPEEIFVSIKTTQKNHVTRLVPLLVTWLQIVPEPEQV